tara:strand:- start:93163 stop:93573 length:411 start_codon:yes stop_codon:yes gene_type:complete
MKKFVFSVLMVVLSVVSISAQENLAIKRNESIQRGAAIYTDFCVNCHMTTGKGVEKVFPPLANSDFLLNNRNASIKAIKFGQQGEIVVNGVTYNSTMAPLGLSDDEIADVMNYITNTWGNSNSKMITTEEVSKIEQ